MSMIVVLPLAFSGVVALDEPIVDVHYNDFGGVGYFQTPSARFGQVGDFGIGINVNEDYRHYTANMQVYDWFNATARYTQVPDVLFSDDPDFSGDTVYTDKGIDIKMRLWPESRYVPQIAVGLQDLGGTGLFDGEYLVASKRFGQLDLTAGLGFGYLGQAGDLSNKTSAKDDCGRDQSFGNNGGQIDYERWFSGCKSIFGGVSYQFSHTPLTLVAEYDGNDYSRDFPVLRERKDLSADSRINLGAIYSYKRFIDFKLSYQRGNTLTLGFNVKSPMGRLVDIWRPAQPDSPVIAGDVDHLVNNLRQYSGLGGIELYEQPDELTIVAYNGKYRDRELMVQQAALALTQYAPDAKQVSVVEQLQNQYLVEYSINTNDYQLYEANGYLEAKLNDTYQRNSAPIDVDGQLIKSYKVPYSYGWRPSIVQSLGGSEGFYTYALGVKAYGGYWLNEKLQVTGEINLNLIDNFDKFNYTLPPDGTFVPRVRSLVRKYLVEYDLRATNLQLTYQDRLADSLYVSAYGGYLEAMFGGVGGEMLYRPFDQNWAIGFDVAYVKQRDPAKRFGFYDEALQTDDYRPYLVQTGTLTGHLNLYYNANFKYLPDTQFQLNVGKYLAEDVGATLTISRTLKSGVKIGAFAAKTDMTAEEFGEGSFNKGFFIEVPFDRLLGKPSVRALPVSWVPLTRDGGQKLQRYKQLYHMTEARSGQ